MIRSQSTRPLSWHQDFQAKGLVLDGGFGLCLSCVILSWNLALGAETDSVAGPKLWQPESGSSFSHDMGMKACCVPSECRGKSSYS